MVLASLSFAQERINAVGPVIFSLAFSLPLYVVHILYIEAVVNSSNSVFKAAIQILLYLLPHILWLISKARQMYARGLSSRPARWVKNL